MTKRSELLTKLQHGLTHPAEGRQPQVVTYERDDGALTAKQLEAIRTVAKATLPKGKMLARRSLFDVPSPPERDSMKSPDETKCPECFDRVVARIRRMIEESGDPAGFDVIVWTAAWIKRPLPALGGQTPRDAMRSEEGCELVLTLVDRMQSGAYS